MEPWYKIAGPRKEVREGRSFNPDEFAMALHGTATKVCTKNCNSRKAIVR